MKLLIITQKVDKNDDVLGFMHRWIAEFAQYYQSITVICLYSGQYSLPSNVKVLSLGKEKNKGKLSYLVNFYKYIFFGDLEYDQVFVHMNPVYLILVGWLWRLRGKSVGLWYTHKQVDMKLRIAEKFANVVFSASKESFRLPTNKLLVTGHAIDTELFIPVAKPATINREVLDKEGRKFNILTIGRISRTKKLDVLIDACAELLKSNLHFELIIVGKPLTTDDVIYDAELKKKIASTPGLGSAVKFVGSIPYEQTINWLKQASVFVNLSQTGSMDKAVLEAMASGVPIITSNEAFASIVGEKILGFNFVTQDAALSRLVAKLIAEMIEVNDVDQGKLRKYVVDNHSLKTTIKKIVQKLS